MSEYSQSRQQTPPEPCRCVSTSPILLGPEDVCGDFDAAGHAWGKLYVACSACLGEITYSRIYPNEDEV